jgi:inorganic triphosphatase YgiF
MELKLELSKSDVQRFGSELAVGDLLMAPAATKKLRTVYFDTPKHDLRAAGISLRLRGQNGGWLQTVKADQHVADGVSNPIELEAPVAGKEPRQDCRQEDQACHSESRTRNHTASRI